MVLESECICGVGAFEIGLLKVSSLKLSRPSVRSLFQGFSCYSLLQHSLGGRREGQRIGGFVEGSGNLW
jgi:hypothetical protein